MLLDRPLKLTRGKGNGIDTACLMTASNMLIGRGDDGDENSCVCPLLRAFIVPTNDCMPAELLGEIYGPLAWEILGTRTDDSRVLQARAYCFADWAVREIAPLALRAAGLTGEANRLAERTPIMDYSSASAAANAASAAASAAVNAAYTASVANAAVYAENAANAAANAASAAANAASAAANAAYTASVAKAAAYTASVASVAAKAASVAAKAANAAANAANAAYTASAAQYDIWPRCAEIIRRVAAIGDKRPVECVITGSELCDALGRL